MTMIKAPTCALGGLYRWVRNRLVLGSVHPTVDFYDLWCDDEYQSTWIEFDRTHNTYTLVMWSTGAPTRVGGSYATFEEAEAALVAAHIIKRFDQAGGL